MSSVLWWHQNSAAGWVCWTLRAGRRPEGRDGHLPTAGGLFSVIFHGSL